MRLAKDEQCMLLEALGELSRGNASRFEDLLWLGFGNAWCTIRRVLVQHEYVSLEHQALQSQSMPHLTPKGRQLVSELRHRVEQN